MTLETNLIFDTSLYKDLAPATRKDNIREDLAGLVLEAGDRPLVERINPRRFSIVDGEVVDENGESLLLKFSRETEFGRIESGQAESFYDHLTKSEPGATIVAISPSGGPANYKEARINVGIKTAEDKIEYYGIPSKLSPTTLMYKADIASEYSPVEVGYIAEPELLRKIVIPIEVPEGINTWKFMEEILPIDSEVWIDIENGKPWEIKNAAIIDADPIAGEMSNRIEHSASSKDFIRAGSWGEQMMAKAGWKLNTSGCAGIFNTEAANTLANFSVRVDKFGNERMVEGKWSYHRGKCVNPGCTHKGEYVDVGPCSICKDCEKIL